MYDTYAYFWVGEFEGSPEAVTAVLGLEPTETWKKGDPWLENRPRQSSRWRLMSPLPRTEMFMDKHLEALLSILEPKTAAIRVLQTEHEIGINCVGYFYGENPGFHLSRGLIARLHALSLDIDFDLYCCGEKDSV
jgi:hypothetical protein